MEEDENRNSITSDQIDLKFQPIDFNLRADSFKNYVTLLASACQCFFSLNLHNWDNLIYSSNYSVSIFTQPWYSHQRRKLHQKLEFQRWNISLSLRLKRKSLRNVIPSHLENVKRELNSMPSCFPTTLLSRPKTISLSNEHLRGKPPASSHQSSQKTIFTWRRQQWNTSLTNRGFLTCFHLKWVVFAFDLAYSSHNFR